MVTVTESFDGTNGTSLAEHNPAFVPVDGAGAFSIESNQLRCDDWADVCSRYDGSGIGAAQYAQAVLGSPDQFRYMGVAVRCSDSAETYYACSIHTDNITLLKFVEGVQTGLGSFTQSYTGGEVVRLEINGDQLRVLVDDVERITATDNEITNGDPGVYGNGGAAATRLNNWEAGDLSGPDITPPTITRNEARDITSGNAFIEVDTDEPTTVAVDWGVNPGDYVGRATSDTLGATHRIELPGIASGRTIYYRVTATDAAQNSTQANEQAFQALPGTGSVIDSIAVDRIAFIYARLTCTTTRAGSVRVSWSGGGESGQSYWSAPGTNHELHLRGLPQGVTINYSVETDGAITQVGSFDTQICNVGIGMNLMEPNDATGHTRLFVDCHKLCRPWVDNAFNPIANLAPAIPRNGTGYPTAIPPDATGGQSTACFRTFIFDDLQGQYPTGDYTVIVVGDMSGMVWERDWTEVSRDGNRVTMRVTTPTNAGIGYRVESINGADPITSVRVIMPGQDENDAIHSDAGGELPGEWIRAMDLVHINEKAGTHHPPVAQSYADVVSEDYYTFNPGESQNGGGANGGVPYSMLVKLANALNKHLWLCIPHHFQLADWTQVATETLGINPGLKLGTEWSNETWNGDFLQRLRSQVIGAARNLPGNVDEQGWKATGEMAVELAEEFRRVFGARSGDIVGIYAGQAGRVDVAQTALSHLGANVSKLDVLAIAPYTGEYLGVSPKHLEVRDWTFDQVHDELRSHLFDQGETNRGLPNPVSGAWKRVADHAPLATQHSLEHWGYEDGQHLVGVAGNENDTQLQSVFNGTNRHPRMFDHYAERYLVFQQLGMARIVAFNFKGFFSKWGSWPAIEPGKSIGEDGRKLDALTRLSGESIPAPSNLAVAQNGPGSLRAVWTNNATGATGIRVERRPEGGTWSVVATLPPTATGYDADGLDAGSYHDFRVQAVQGSNASLYSAVVGGRVEGGGGGTNLTPPDGLLVAPNGPGSLALSWVPRASGHDGHRIERRDVSAGSTWEVVGVLAPASAGVLLSGMTPDTDYEVRIIAYEGQTAGDPSSPIAFGGPSGTTDNGGPTSNGGVTQDQIRKALNRFPRVIVADPEDLFDLIVHGELR